MGRAEIEIAFGRIKEIYDEELKWKLYYMTHMNDAGDIQRNILNKRLSDLESEKDSLIRSINMY